MTEYTRVTIQGDGRKADLVLPDDEPVAAMLPDVLTLLAEDAAHSSRPVALMTRVGDQLDPSLTLAEQDIEHGALLRVVRVDEAPPPPEIADVTDIAADAASSRPDVWRRTWSVVAAGAVAAVLGAFGAEMTTQVLRAPGVVLASVLAALAVAAIALGRRAQSGAAAVATLAAVGVAVVVAQLLVTTSAYAPGAAVVAWLGLACLTVAIVGFAGFSDPASGLGGTTGTVLVLALVAMDGLGWDLARSAAFVAVLGCFVLGLLPGIAMTISGLTGLDDRIVQGQGVSRVEAHQAVDATHRTLTWATLAAAVVTGACTWFLAGGIEPWGRFLALAVASVLLLRTRVFPLAPQRLALLGAAAAGFFALLAGVGETEPAAALSISAGIVAVLTVLLAVNISEHVRARLRRLANIVELVAVLSLVPLVLAHLGVFTDLLETF